MFSMATKQRGQRLRRLRQSAGLSQLALALKAGFAPNTIQRWEVGGSWPRSTDLQKLAVALGVRPEDLTGPNGN
jgi:transcriptional regulator with XRE-family HTH domain